MKNFFTTGQAAKLCNVASRTISKWFDNGLLKGYRLPGSDDRRIPRIELIHFMRKSGLPLGDLAEKSILVLSTEGLKIEHHDYTVVNNVFEAGIKFNEQIPEFIIVDFIIGRSLALSCGKFFTNCYAIALLNEDEANTREVLESGFKRIFVKPFDGSALVEAISQIKESRKCLKHHKRKQNVLPLQPQSNSA